MNKKDLLLAQKTLAARQMKWESKCPGTAYDPLSSMRRSTESLPTITTNESTINGNAQYNSSGQAKTFSGTDTHSPFKDTHANTNASVSFDSSAASSPVARKLGHRAMTAVGGLRKMHQLTAIEVNKAASSGTLSFGEDYFIPKTRLMRPDGASLSDVYESKKNDTWATILRAQVKENTIAEKTGHLDKLKADADYGTKLRQQLFQNSQRRDVDKELGDHYARIVEETSKRNDEIQQKRRSDAIKRHKQFIANAVEDMELKRTQTEAYLRSEIEASTLMILAAKRKAEEEQLKKQEMKEIMKLDQERRYKENLEALRRKEELKIKYQLEEKKMAQENEMRAQREKEKRDRELGIKLVRTTEGPVHKINREILAAQHDQIESFYKHNESVPNSLTLQLQTSEEGAYKRATADSKYLCKDWDYNIKMKAQRKSEEQKWLEKVGKDMKEIIRKNVDDEEKRRADHRKSCLKYQHDLDNQLGHLRQKSLQALTETMNERERAINKKLIDKSAQMLQS